MHNRHRWDGLADDAAGGDHRAASNGYVRQDDHSGSDESILLDLYALSFAEVRDHQEKSSIDSIAFYI